MIVHVQRILAKKVALVYVPAHLPSILQASKSCVDQPTCEPISSLAIGNYPHCVQVHMQVVLPLQGSHGKTPFSETSPLVFLCDFMIVVKDTGIIKLCFLDSLEKCAHMP